MAKYEIQLDCAGKCRVIRTGKDGIRRAWDNPPCRTAKAARKFIQDCRQADRDGLDGHVGPRVPDENETDYGI